ncbi:MAG: HU family DNA-binding protein [Rhodospirillales bacterium]|nr:HU family DNA-binding protein [Rhodospirillales bacterium]
MNKNDLIVTVANGANLSKADAARAVEAVFETIVKSLKRKEKVLIVGFGTFSTSKRKASTGRNPRTGEALKIAASVQAKFKAGQSLKDALN